MTQNADALRALDEAEDRIKDFHKRKDYDAPEPHESVGVCMSIGKILIPHLATIKTALSNGGGWRSIESAPTDQTWVVLAFYCEHSLQWICKGQWGRYGQYGWYDSGGQKLREPTHWQPLPSPPAEGK